MDLMLGRWIRHDYSIRFSRVSLFKGLSPFFPFHATKIFVGIAGVVGAPLHWQLMAYWIYSLGYWSFTRFSSFLCLCTMCPHGSHRMRQN